MQIFLPTTHYQIQRKVVTLSYLANRSDPTLRSFNIEHSSFQRLDHGRNTRPVPVVRIELAVDDLPILIDNVGSGDR